MTYYYDHAKYKSTNHEKLTEDRSSFLCHRGNTLSLTTSQPRGGGKARRTPSQRPFGKNSKSIFFHLFINSSFKNSYRFPIILIRETKWLGLIATQADAVPPSNSPMLVNNNNRLDECCGRQTSRGSRTMDIRER